MQLLSMELTRFATLGCQKFLMPRPYLLNEASNRKNKATFYPPTFNFVYWDTFSSKFEHVRNHILNFYFGLWHPWRAGMAGLAVLVA